MAEDNSLITRTLAALLTEQHQLSSFSKRQADFSEQQVEVIAQQGAAIEKLAGMVSKHGELLRNQSSLLKEQAAASERQASRIEELIGLMGSFADGGAELRQRLGRCEERLDKLEDAG